MNQKKKSDRKDRIEHKNDKNSKKKIKPWSSKKKSAPEKVIIERLRSQYKKVNPKRIKSFDDLPLSDATRKGLKDQGFTAPTEIQRESMGFSLSGQDILGAAKTGSGKTLAFLIPVLEILYCKQWTRLDGTGALIITPTRELAYQIFETLRKIGVHHDFSAGLIIGGKDLKFERSRMDQINIIICTPGRLLQHFDENPLFDCANLQVLVLDEADRILDLGFQQAMNSIIQNLPAERQTLLFSATQTKSVRDLARLSLRDPMYISVHEHAAHSTPESLAQSYLVCELEEKVTILFSFLKNHVKHKVIVFMASCNEVKYMLDAFTQLRTGVPILSLYGTLSQMRRMAIYEEFCRKARAVLFATDIAARGLDFPAVNWVVQFDCPEDAETYIHRAGRTARLEKSGESLLFLLPSEKDTMLKRLEDRKIPIKEIQVNPEKLQNPSSKLEAFLAQSRELKESAQRAFVSYFKSVFLMKDKEVFKVQALNTDAFARSLGLAISPRIRFLQRNLKREEKQKQIKTEKLAADGQKASVSKSTDGKSNGDKNSSSDESGDDSLSNSVSDSRNRIKATKKEKSEELNFNYETDDDDDDDDVLKVKRQNHELAGDILPLTEEELSRPESKKKTQPITKAAAAKKFLKKKIQMNKKVAFNEDGDVVLDPKSQKVSALAQEYEAEDVGGIDIEKAKAMMKEEDRIDKQKFRERIRAKHREEKKKLKSQKEEEVHDDFSSSDESGGPDLSWLPDPDKIYGSKKSDDEDVDDKSDEEFDSDIKLKNKKQTRKYSSDSEDEGTESPNEDNSPPPRRKRKLEQIKKNKSKKARADTEASFATLDTGLSLQEDEELALKFLRASRT